MQSGPGVHPLGGSAFEAKMMKDVSALISSVATLLWPMFAFVSLFIYRKQIGDLLARLRKGKLLGQEIELGESLDRLEKSASAVAEEVAALPHPSEDERNRSISNIEGAIDSILREAAQSPKAALILLASDLEREARQLLASIGLLEGRGYLPLSKAIDALHRHYGALPGHIPSSLKLFWEVRNRLVHGRQADDEEVLRAIDSGITILKALRAIPRETNYVYHPGVDIYRDPDCKIPWTYGKGVILETETPGRTRRFLRIFPTMKTHFQKGERVGWEWDSDTVWSDAWYKDPESGEIKLAWNSSSEFVGRHLKEI